MVSFNFEDYKDNSYELKVVSILKQLKGCEYIHTIADNFTKEVELIPRKSVAMASTSYRLRWVGDPWGVNPTFQVWHVGKKDRLICTVSKKTTI